jgi:undecaprenyl-diphosphatase
VSNGLKPVFGRPQPRHRRVRKPQVMRGSFPSGHGAAEIAYTFGAAQEIHPTLLPFGALAILGHWSLVRAGKHYTSDMLGGKAMGLAVVALTARLWPPAGPTKGIPARLAGEPAEGGRELRRHAATPLTGG